MQWCERIKIVPEYNSRQSQGWTFYQPKHLGRSCKPSAKFSLQFLFLYSQNNDLPNPPALYYNTQKFVQQTTNPTLITFLLVVELVDKYIMT
jgi:hypothetical protein